MKNTLRWIMFIPIAFLASIVSDFILRFLFLKLGISLLFAGTFLDVYEIVGIDFKSILLFFFASISIPALNSMFFVYTGTYISPKKKTAAIILFCFTILSISVSLITKYMTIIPGIASALGCILAFYNLNESGMFQPNQEHSYSEIDLDEGFDEEAVDKELEELIGIKSEEIDTDIE